MAFRTEDVFFFWRSTPSEKTLYSKKFRSGYVPVHLVQASEMWFYEESKELHYLTRCLAR